MEEADPWRDEMTEVGRIIIDQAKVVLYNVEQITEMTRSEKEALTGPLRIALISTVAPVLVPGLFKHVGDKCPSIALQTEEMLTDTIKDKLRKAEVDMGILAGPVNDPDLLEIPLYHERILAYVSPDNPAYAQENSQQNCLRPIVDPVPGRTISLVIRADYIHETKLNAIVDAVRQIIPGTLLEGVIRKGRLS